MPKEDDLQIVGQGGERKGINRWPFGTLLLIITIDSEFSTKMSFAHCEVLRGQAMDEHIIGLNLWKDIEED